MTSDSALNMVVPSSNPARSIQRILVVRLGAMGDVLHALPAVTALRTLFPQAEIGWAIEERWAELLCSQPQSGISSPCSPQKPLVNTIHFVNTRTWRKSPFCAGTREAVVRAVRELRQPHYDVAIDFQGAWKSVLVAMLSQSRIRLGFRQPRERGASMFYHRAVITTGTHVIEQNVSLLSELSPVVPVPTHVPLPKDEAREQWADEEIARRGLKEFAVINPGAGWGAKCWPAKRYAEVARGLAQQGICSIINFGPGEEDLAHAVEAASGGAAQALSCRIGELIAIMRRARLFVGGDTGPMHLAAALHVPVVGIFGPTNPARNGPYRTRSAVLRSPQSLTNHSHRATPDTTMLSIVAADVLTAARNLLEQTQEARRG
jgi:heptosyltransferase-1